MQLVVLFRGTVVGCRGEAGLGPGCINKLAFTKGTELGMSWGSKAFHS